MYSIKLDLVPKIKRMELFSKTVLAGARQAASARSIRSKQAFRSKGLEFEKFRDYSPSDDASMIDWKASLRANKLLVKIFSEEQNKDILFFVDVSSSMSYSSFGKLKNEYAAEMVSSLSYALMNSGDNIGLIMFTDRFTGIAPLEAGPGQYTRITHLLEDSSRYDGPFDLVSAMNSLIGYLKRGAILIIISDFIGLQPGWEKIIETAAEKNELIAVMIRDPLDDEIPKGNFAGEVVLSDPYSEEQVTVYPLRIRKAYAEYNKRRIEEIKTVFSKVRADLVHLQTNKPFDEVIRQFLLYR